jgi:CRP/FNR family cyclic AMP-dependent transcriptional regulator
VVITGTTPLRFRPPAKTLSHTETADYLATVSLFRGIDRSALSGFSELAREHRFANRGSLAIDAEDALVIVRSGEAKLVLTGEDGRVFILQTFTAGDHFTERSLPRASRVVFNKPSSVLVFRSAGFQGQLALHPIVAWRLLMELSRRLRHADATIGKLVMLDVPGRVATLLLEHAAAGEPATLVRQLTHHTMAQMIGASRETVSRTMADFQDKGLIRVQRRTVTIIDRTALEARARTRA